MTDDNAAGAGVVALVSINQTRVQAMLMGASFGGQAPALLLAWHAGRGQRGQSVVRAATHDSARATADGAAYRPVDVTARLDAASTLADTGTRLTNRCALCPRPSPRRPICSAPAAAS